MYTNIYLFTKLFQNYYQFFFCDNVLVACQYLLLDGRSCVSSGDSDCLAEGWSSPSAAAEGKVSTLYS